MGNLRAGSSGRRLYTRLFAIGVLSAGLCTASVAGHAQIKSASASGPNSVDLPDAPGFALQAAEGTDGRADKETKEHQVSVIDSPMRMVRDEVHVVTSPARIHKTDLRWLVPLAGVVAVSFATDRTTMRDVVSQNPSFNGSAMTASDTIRNTFIGIPVVLFGVGELGHDDHMRETGILGGEAMIDSYVLGEVLKFATYRERPNVDNARGLFYQTSAGTDSSFPSGHALVSWSSAAVLAGEYNRPWEQATIYTAATGVSLTRVLGREHFPSDVVVGSVAGWLIGHYVYRAHHREPHHSLFRRD